MQSIQVDFGPQQKTWFEQKKTIKVSFVIGINQTNHSTTRIIFLKRWTIFINGGSITGTWSRFYFPLTIKREKHKSLDGLVFEEECESNRELQDGSKTEQNDERNDNDDDLVDKE